MYGRPGALAIAGVLAMTLVKSVMFRTAPGMGLVLQVGTLGGHSPTCCSRVAVQSCLTGMPARMACTIVSGKPESYPAA